MGRALWVCLFVAATTSPRSDSRPAGDPACANCHSEAKANSSMSEALETVEECKILISHPLLVTVVGKYSYRIERKGDQSNLSVSDGATTVTMPILWAMGASSAFGQTYILEKDGNFFESRVSYFSELIGLAPTLGSEGSTPADVNEAAGRLISHDEELRCFGCHATQATERKQLTLGKMMPGVRCRRCHEGVEAHLAEVIQGSYDLGEPKELTKLDKMSAQEVSDFCGQCHRTWAEIAVQTNPSIANIRFQPYRLTSSKCFDPDDARISCLACHDPHHEVNTNSADYDEKCMACHGGGKPGARACAVAKDRCVTCHMPKLALPGAHHKFSDHRIRIVRPNEKYPG
jgi:Cytochrome c554 and c-prime